MKVLVVAVLALALGLPAAADAQLRYDREYPTIPYSSGQPTDPVARLWQRVEAGGVTLSHEGQSGYLRSFLEALEIPVESQALVFTRTSLQKSYISPRTPRAIYFGDEVYVAWVPGTNALEVAAVDPLMGSVFYTVSQGPDGPQLQRQQGLCLQCHDTYGLTGGGVPELLTGSMLPDAKGNAVYHEGWSASTHRTPIGRRWGGWYVTGTHGEQTHLGNVVVDDPARAPALDFRETGNVTELGALVDTSPYPGEHSDLVALMVFEHQITVQNLIIRLGYRLRTALHEAGLPADASAEAPLPEPVRAVLADQGEALVKGLLFSNEAPLSAPVRGTSGYAERFQAEGPRDSEGRSLRELDLDTRMFRYPLSYLIYSAAFDGLPPLGRAYVYRRLREVLGGEDRSEPFAHLSAADRAAILEILGATDPEFAAVR